MEAYFSWSPSSCSKRRLGECASVGGAMKLRKKELDHGPFYCTRQLELNLCRRNKASTLFNNVEIAMSA